MGDRIISGLSLSQQQQLRARMKSNHKIDTNALKQFYDMSIASQQSNQQSLSQQPQQYQLQANPHSFVTPKQQHQQPQQLQQFSHPSQSSSSSNKQSDASNYSNGGKQQYYSQHQQQQQQQLQFYKEYQQHVMQRTPVAQQSQQQPQQQQQQLAYAQCSELSPISEQPQAIDPKHETVQSLGNEDSIENTPVNPRKSKRVNFIDGTISEDYSTKPVTSGLNEIASMLSRFEIQEGRYDEDPIQQEEPISFDDADICTMQSPWKGSQQKQQQYTHSSSKSKRLNSNIKCEEISITQTMSPPAAGQGVTQAANSTTFTEQTPKKLNMKSALKPISCSRMSLQQSLCDEDMLAEMRKWESEYGVERDFVAQIESTFKVMEDRIQGLEAQFEISFNLSKKMDEKYSDLHRLLRGAAVYKVSRRNKKKAHLRIFSYSAELEAFCWKSPKDFFPDKKQLIYLKQIKEIKTSLDDPTRRLPAPFTESQYLRIVMLDKSASDLELICEDPMLRHSLVKVLVSLLEGIRKSRASNRQQRNGGGSSSLMDSEHTEFLISKHAKDVENIREQMNRTQGLFADSTSMLREAFVKATSSLLAQEKAKRKKQEGQLRALQEDSRQNQNRKESYDFLAQENLRLKEEIASLMHSVEMIQTQHAASSSFFSAEITRAINTACAILPIDYVQELLSRESQQQQDIPHSNSMNNNNAEVTHLLGMLQACVERVVDEVRVAATITTTMTHNSSQQVPSNALKGQAKGLQEKHEQILVEYQKLLREKKELVESQEKCAHELNVRTMERNAVQASNSALTSHVQDLLAQIAAKEDHFNSIVEGIQEMREEMLVQMNQVTVDPADSLRMTFLESKIKQKDEQIKHLSLLLDSKFLKSNESTLEGSLKIKKHGLSQQQSDSQSDNQSYSTSIRNHNRSTTGVFDKENVNPNIMASSKRSDSHGYLSQDSSNFINNSSSKNQFNMTNNNTNGVFVNASFAGPKSNFEFGNSVLKGSATESKLRDSERLSQNTILGVGNSSVKNSQQMMTNSGFFGMSSNLPIDKQFKNSRSGKPTHHHFYSQSQF